MASSADDQLPRGRAEIGREGHEGEQEEPAEIGAEAPRGEREEAGAPAPHGERTERYGPITLTRHEKGDGRALILYTHEERGET
jgi:hypothetical protein